MTFEELKNSASVRKQSSAIILDRRFPAGIRFFLRNFFLALAIASFFFSIFGENRIFNLYWGVLADGIALVSLGLFIILAQLEAFYNSSRFSGIQTRLHEYGFQAGPGATYQTALAMWEADDFDITASFLKSKPAWDLLLRLGVSEESVNHYLLNKRNNPSVLDFESNFIAFADYAAAIYSNDESLQAFFSAHSVGKKDFLGAARWVEKIFNRKESKKRFWSREKLESISSIGTSLSYGVSYEVGKFGAPLRFKVDLNSVDLSSGYREEETAKLENALAKREEANAIIVDDDESVARGILERLLKKMKSGASLGSLEHKEIIELEWNSLMSEMKNKAEFEKELLAIMRGAVFTGNVIIYMPNFPEFILSAKNIGSNLGPIFEEFFKSSGIQLIVHSTKTDFHYFIETNPGLVSAFERIIPEELGGEGSMPAIIEKAEALEKEWGIFFTYQSLEEIAFSAENRITYGEMPFKAFDLLGEICPWAASEKIEILTKADASLFISKKTGMPAGEISEEEGEKLAKLEEILHQRIVGQDAAIDAVSSALRRSRSGITNSKKPMASFLFLGSTGVGKTETSKALAESFFGGSPDGEEKMIRIDMSEYNGADALPRLIGSWGDNKAGVLASKIRDNPYGVLLLDEFEKASPDVLDLFLQILDEGIFTDALGKQVNCRSLIIIATSNAGSQIIWEMVKGGKDLEANKNKIIDDIVQRGLFKPELLNRFDGIIVFQPLGAGELRHVAEMMFERFQKRLEEEKQIKVTAAPTLLDYLVSRGADREFGARSINRVMQEKVEDFVAKKIISGELKAGSSIEIKAEHLNMA